LSAAPPGVFWVCAFKINLPGAQPSWGLSIDKLAEGLFWASLSFISNGHVRAPTHADIAKMHAARSTSTPTCWPPLPSVANSPAWVEIRQRERQRDRLRAKNARRSSRWLQYINPRGWVRGALFLPDGTRLNADVFELVVHNGWVGIYRRRSGCERRRPRCSRPAGIGSRL